MFTSFSIFIRQLPRKLKHITPPVSHSALCGRDWPRTFRSWQHWHLFFACFQRTGILSCMLLATLENHGIQTGWAYLTANDFWLDILIASVSTNGMKKRAREFYRRVTSP